MPLTSPEYAMLAAFRYKLRQFLAFSEKTAAKAGVIISMYDTGGCMNSRRKAISMAELGQLLMRRFT